MIGTQMHTNELTSAQYELVNALACLHRKSDVVALKSLLVGFINDRLQSELDDLYESGDISDEKFESLANQHLRTPYKVLPC